MTGVPGDPVVQSGSTALFGMPPGGRRLTAQSTRPGVALVNTLQELNELALNASGASRPLRSIVIVARPGDDLSIAGQIYTLAVNLHILVTAILIHDIGTATGNTGAGVQTVSDIIVHSADAGCIGDMLDTMTG